MLGGSVTCKTSSIDTASFQLMQFWEIFQTNIFLLLEAN